MDSERLTVIRSCNLEPRNCVLALEFIKMRNMTLGVFTGKTGFLGLFCLGLMRGVDKSLFLLATLILLSLKGNLSLESKVKLIQGP